MPTNLVLLAVSAVLYGAIFPINRWAADAGWPPVAFAAAQLLLGGVALAAIERLRGNRLLRSVADVRSYAVIGALSMAVPTALLTATAGHVAASMLTLVLALSPGLTLLFSAALKLDRLRPRVAVAMLCGFAGVLLIASPWSHALSAAETPWFLVALLVPVSFASANVSAALLRPPEVGPGTMAAGLLLAGGVVLVPLALLIDPSLLPGTMGGAAVATLLAGTVVNAVVIIMFFEVIRRAGPTFGSLFHYVALPAGVVWSIAAFGVLPPAIFWVAVVVMLGAVAAAVGGPRQAG